MPISPAGRRTAFSFSPEQSNRDFMERSGWKFRKTPDRLQQQGFNRLHAAYAFNLARPLARSPLAMSILVALYLSGAAPARATETACSPSSVLKVFPLRNASTVVSRYGLPEMPPNTTRESSIVLSRSWRLIPSEAMAKSQTPRGRSFSNDARTPGFGGGMTTEVRISL